MTTKELAVREQREGLAVATVLIVDDQPETLSSLRRLLRDEPFQLVTLRSAADAIAWIEGNRVDLLISDERMPDMRGSDLLDEVRRRSPETIRVILTGYPGSTTVQYGLSQGIDWLISKPWNDEGLKLTIRQLLEELPADRAERRFRASRRADPVDYCDGAPVALRGVGPDGVILWANQAELKLLGYRHEEYVGRSIAEFHADPGGAAEFLRRLARRETVAGVEARLRCKDGSLRDVRIDATGLWDGDTFTGAACVTRDAGSAPAGWDREELETTVRERTRDLHATNDELIHEIAERKRAEGTQRLSDLRFRLLVESVKDYAIDLLSPDGIVVSWNVGAERIKGYAAEEILGRHHSVFYPPEEIAAGRPGRLLLAAEERGHAEDDGWRLRKDGSRFWCNIVVTALRDSDGSLVGFAKVTRDLSEQRRAEAERAKLDARMLQGQKLQAIGQLSAGIAHEINNPVGYILSNLNTLGDYVVDLKRIYAAAAAASEARARGTDPSESLDKFRRIAFEANAEHMVADLSDLVSDCKLGGEKIRDIVRSLREFSHVDEGQLRPADLNACLDDALRICWSELKYKAEVHKDYQHDQPAIPCYPQRLGQVFLNLLVNAGQAIEKRGHIHLSTRIEGNEVVVRVRDTGKGISPEHRGKIFEPFFTPKKTGMGTGLGLHVAYKIVTAHRGKIEISSEPGRGTEFTVRLPAGSALQKQ